MTKTVDIALFYNVLTHSTNAIIELVCSRMACTLPPPYPFLQTLVRKRYGPNMPHRARNVLTLC